MRAVLVALAIWVFGAGATVAQGASFNTVIEVADPRSDRMSAALNLALNLARDNALYAPGSEVRVIAMGEGLRLLRADTSPMASRVTFTQRSLKGVSFWVGQDELDAIAAREGQPPPLIDIVRIAPNAASAIALWKAEGFSIIRP